MPFLLSFFLFHPLPLPSLLWLLHKLWSSVGWLAWGRIIEKRTQGWKLFYLGLLVLWNSVEKIKCTEEPEIQKIGQPLKNVSGSLTYLPWHRSVEIFYLFTLIKMHNDRWQSAINDSQVPVKTWERAERTFSDFFEIQQLKWIMVYLLYYINVHKYRNLWHVMNSWTMRKNSFIAFEDF